MNHKELVNEVHTLLAYLRSFEVVSLVKQFFDKYNNPNPPYLLEDQITKIEREIDGKTKL